MAYVCQRRSNGFSGHGIKYQQRLRDGGSPSLFAFGGPARRALPQQPGAQAAGGRGGHYKIASICRRYGLVVQ
jgi:hypothetical protein